MALNNINKLGGNRGVLIVGTGEDPSIMMEYAKRHALGMPDVYIAGSCDIGEKRDGSISELLSFKCKEVMQQLTLLKEDIPAIDEPFHYVSRKERRAKERKNKKKE
jgi:hypothetical protein